ncbi:apolipoprotein N-acyltransferase [Meiothermus granaticius]|uniref:Apolipoprotein N-acyltransferase n=1 Tax=Meiothermus granaticius NBRC 107808 TaxID=1227551 RepID=A0A399FAC7_9DEIN|nr:apolipoprotein N-acyltransferase [Meiothermus granaticius]RIH91601.1 Apolipoprotein N-acyltransferase [Meiothermus granaticius NBRC 107808]GEM88211.1 apolipoprotein N-acyltransferase [Meiothermus granaticius NBRC 107808]
MQIWQALFLGTALALTLPPTPLGFLAPLPLIGLLWRGGFGYGLWAGLAFWAVHLVWLPQSFVVLFHTPWGAVPYVPLVVIKALSWGVVFGLSAGRPLLRVGLWVILEYLTSLGEIAFPWGFLGYALVEAPGRILARVGGVYLLSLVVLLIAYFLGRFGRAWWASPAVFSPASTGLLLSLLAWVGLWFLPLPAARGDQTALLVQGNINPLQKLEGVSAENTYLELTRQGLAAHPEARVVLWPETAVAQFPPGLSALLGPRELISGLETGLTNRAVRVVNGQIQETYDKNRLVPFGERFPWRQELGPAYHFFFRAFGFDGDLADRVEGSGYTPLGRYGAYICYESVFPSVSRNLVQRGAQVLELGSNDAWYGPSFGGMQHFQMGRLRAVETGRWLLRAGNDGVTAIVDPYGRVTAQIPQHQAGFLVGTFASLQGQTLYVRLGDWAVGLAGILGLFGLLSQRKSRIV